MPIPIEPSPEKMQQACQAFRAEGKRIGFVPTMGALHRGHVSLMERARAENDVVAVSLFVNPTQFGPKEDFSKYPRDLEGDSRLCERAGAGLIFAPTPQLIYPDGYATYVVQEKLTDVLCGASRPGHFRGVLTVCAKLFNIVQPHAAYFGAKDFQQTVVIRRMVRDLNLPLRIVVCPTVRDPDGLALSSRNQYLTPQQRPQALSLSQSLEMAKHCVTNGECNPAVISEFIRFKIAQQPEAKIDYIAIVDPETLQPVSRIEGETLIALAVFIGATRLIDNALVGSGGV